MRHKNEVTKTLFEALLLAKQYLLRAIADGELRGCVLPVSRALEIVEAALAKAEGGLE